MGCLNSEGLFKHWFANIHLSGPCNRACYFCIGQHMMALDSLNNLDTWPLPNIDKFVDQCLEHNVNEINVTGTNTDPLLYQHTDKLHTYLKERIPNLVFGLRTNGVLALQRPEIMALYNKGSITVCSLRDSIYKLMMGQGSPPNVEAIKHLTEELGWSNLKANIVLGKANCNIDLHDTIYWLSKFGFTKVNVREPYGQPHIGNPFPKATPIKMTLGMPTYKVDNCEVTYWDVHYVEVESVNLYANGNVSMTYPITKGHDSSGKVMDQSNFPGGRVQEQWISLRKKKI